MKHPLRPRIPRRPVHGVLLLDKPLGLSSNDALQKAKRLFRAEKAGHTGTLDPLATGLLPICFGAATKFSQVSLDADKRYTATLQLGTTTTTGDAEGDIVETRPVQMPDGSPDHPRAHRSRLRRLHRPDQPASADALRAQAPGQGTLRIRARRHRDRARGEGGDDPPDRGAGWPEPCRSAFRRDPRDHRGARDGLHRA